MKDQFLAADIAEEILNSHTEEGQKIFLHLDSFQQSEVFSKLSFERQYQFFLFLEKNFILVFEEMPSDERNSFYRNLEKEEQVNLLPFLKKHIRQELLEFSSYPHESAGSIMSTEYTCFNENTSVTDVLNHLREEGKESKLLIYYIYTTDEALTLKGVVSLRDLLFSGTETSLKEIAYHNIVISGVFEDQESVAKKIEKYDLLAIPVINTKGQLVGIVSHEDALDIIRSEEKEDLEKFMGIVSTGEETYTSLSVFEHFQKRFIWIILLAAVGLLASFIVDYYRIFLERHSLLTIFMPLMTATGGNTASQVASVIITSLSLGELSKLSSLKIFLKEFKIAFLLGSFISFFLLISIYLFFKDLFLAKVIAISILFQILSSTFLATAIPLGIYKINKDPAVAASPAISTIVDITGLLIYFWITSLFY
jgi:magnesium transporter